MLDHHQAPRALPTARAVVNPNRQDDLSGLGHLCAAGVVFLALVALNRALARARLLGQRGPRPTSWPCSTSWRSRTVADVVPLTGLNRAFVRQGLAVMRARRRAGLAALLDVARLGGRAASLPPRLPASARASTPAGASATPRSAPSCCSATDAYEAGRIAAELDRLNRERQAIEQAARGRGRGPGAPALDRAPDAPVLVDGLRRLASRASSAWSPRA